MNSHDVVSLFTNVPIKKVMEVIRKKTEGDKKLGDRTNLDADDLMSLLDFMTSTTYFSSTASTTSKSIVLPLAAPSQ